MRISSSNLFSSQNETIAKEMETYSRLMRQAEGKKLVNDSDDPALAGQIFSVRTNLNVMQAYETNLTMASVRSGLFVSAAANASSVTERIHGLILKAQNDTLSDTDRRALSEEIRGQLDILVKIANTQDNNSSYIFSGMASDTPAFSQSAGSWVYMGSAESVNINISSSESIVYSENGSSLFGDLLDSVSSLVDLLGSPVTDLSAYHSALSSIQSKINQSRSDIQAYQTMTSARAEEVKQAASAFETAKNQMHIALSSLEDSDTAAVYSALAQQSVVLQATQAAYVKLNDLISRLLQLQTG